MYTLNAEGDALFLIDGYWVHESLVNIILNMKEEKSYGY